MMGSAGTIFQTENYGCLMQPKILRIESSFIEYRREGSDVLSCYYDGTFDFQRNYRKFYGFDFVCFFTPKIYGEISVIKNQNIYTYGYEMTPYLEFVLNRNQEDRLAREHLSYWLQEFLIDPFLQQEGILYEIVANSIIAIVRL